MKAYHLRRPVTLSAAAERRYHLSIASTPLGVTLLLRRKRRHQNLAHTNEKELVIASAHLTRLGASWIALKRSARMRPAFGKLFAI